MSTAKMAELLEKTEKWDPITPQVIQSMFKNDSRAMQSLGDRWNIPQLSQDARYNQQNPEEGIANASKATALGFLGAGLGGLMNGGGYVDQIGNAAEGAVAGQRTAGLLGAGNNAAAKRYMMNQGMRMMEQPMAPQPPPPPRPMMQQPQQMPSPYMGQLSEEEKRRLLMQGYSIY
jgi:hypothetical protein